jgi:hypothetical protein
MDNVQKPSNSEYKLVMPIEQTGTSMSLNDAVFMVTAVNLRQFFPIRMHSGKSKHFAQALQQGSTTASLL